jgi:CheY-like chemotaxis protein
MPGMDGHEVARRLRATEKGKAMRLVAISGFGQPADRQRSLEAGFDAHLTKPFAVEALSDFLA